MAGVPPGPARLARPPDPGRGRRISVGLERTLDAPIERAWALLRDYRRPRACATAVLHPGFVLT
jgi:hypothetical protein